MIIPPGQVYKLRIGTCTEQNCVPVAEICIVLVELCDFSRTYKGEVFWPPEHNHPLVIFLVIFMCYILEFFSFLTAYYCDFVKSRKFCSYVYYSIVHKLIYIVFWFAAKM